MSERDTAAERLDTLLRSIDGATVQVGLRAQGHLPTVEKMLSAGAGWSAIGRAIGWEGATACEWYVHELRESLAACQRELAEARDWSELLTRGKSPCGHWSAHAVTEDGGKLVTCLDCDIASLTLRAEAAEAERDRLREVVRLLNPNPGFHPHEAP